MLFFLDSSYKRRGKEMQQNRDGTNLVQAIGLKREEGEEAAESKTDESALTGWSVLSLI
jgi:hypothetical protein